MKKDMTYYITQVHESDRRATNSPPIQHRAGCVERRARLLAVGQDPDCGWFQTPPGFKLGEQCLYCWEDEHKPKISAGGENWSHLGWVQAEITRWATEQFPHRTDHQAIYKLMVHEIPEMMTHRKERGTEDIGTELADCFILLLDLASLWGVDAAEAIRAKMAINYGRTWEADANGIMQHVPGAGTPSAPGLMPACPNCHCNTSVITIVEPTGSHQCMTCDLDFYDNTPF